MYPVDWGWKKTNANKNPVEFINFNARTENFNDRLGSKSICTLFQIRKLYEPNLFKGAGVHSIFNKYFGDTQFSEICAVGFEPNSHHTQPLKGKNDSHLQ